MASYNKFNAFVADLAHKVHNLNTSADAIKLALTNTAPVAGNALFSDLTEISAGNGYSAGGTASAVAASSQSGGTLKWTLTDTVITASGGAIGPFRYVVIYNSTPSSPLKPLIGWYDYGSSITLNDGETFTIDVDDTNGTFTLG